MELPKQKEAQEKAQKLSSSIKSGTTKLNPLSKASEIDFTYSGLEENFASLCVLSYERGDYLEKSLESLAKNTNYPYELIIHDDGSSDHRVHKVLGYQAATIINNPLGHNQGQGVALNRMFNMAKGDPIIKLDADLLYYEGWLLETCRILENYQDIGLLGLLHYYHEPVHSHKTVIERHDDYSVHTHILGSGFALRRKTWEQLKPFEEGSEAFSEDWDMQNRVHESEQWKVALPKEDLVKNPAMGYETSTVNKTVAGEMPGIKKRPYIHSTENLGVVL